MADRFFMNILINWLNHASVIIEMGEFRLLTDPWYDGSLFHGGWDLQFNNPNALEKTRHCSHLWISHPHADHFNFKNLTEIARINPELKVLCNISASYNIKQTIKKAGFTQIIPLYERTPLQINGIKIERFPHASIDSMLVLKSKHETVVNFNDCYSPNKFLNKLSKNIGPIDLFLLNFNHAGKLIEFPPSSPEKVKNNLINEFLNIINIFSPKWILPFASHHRYRNARSNDLNQSMLNNNDLANLDSRVIPAQIGDRIQLKSPNQFQVINPTTPLVRNQPQMKIFGESVTWDKLIKKGNEYRKTLKWHYPILRLFIPELHILIDDLNQVLVFNVNKGLKEGLATTNPHIGIHSTDLLYWFSNPFGSDSISIGANYKILSNDINTTTKFMLATQLITNGLSFRNLMKMLTTRSGWSFFWNRREAIIGYLFDYSFFKRILRRG